MSDNIEFKTEELEDILKSIGFEDDEMADILSKAGEESEEEEQEEKKPGMQEDEEGEDDMEKAFDKMKGEYEEKKKAMEDMKAKMAKKKVKKGEDNELGKEKVSEFVKSLTTSIEKSFTEKLEAKNVENEELKKSIEDMSSNYDELKKSIEEMQEVLNTPQGQRGVVRESQILQKSEESFTEDGKEKVSIHNRDRIIKSMNDLIEKSEGEKREAYEDMLIAYESAGQPISASAIKEIQKAEDVIFTK